MPDASTPPATAAIRVWDLPTRLFHWTLALAVIGAVATAWTGGNAMVWHLRLGCGVLALLVFRIGWGLFGGRWSRFASFAWGPAAIARYLRGQALPGERFDIGHNPLGSLSVWALLAILALQVGTGLFADDEIDTVGPLNQYVRTSTGRRLTGWHHGPGQWIVLTLLALHLAAIAWYRWRRGTDLVRPMWRGDKALPPATPASADGWAMRLLALAWAAACAALGVWIYGLGG
ncbi:MAG: cytochrome b/b6 domain-containing protein [Burkholderiales bacterium]|nr:cytochrome b/b6 domain-containing protein [Burkholderiales bacterium]MDE1928878.1 cytochrome b/b6 domain-containing protein [Burkholderiales bacterium]MDE2158426.1 cytochrome b/b6 domain-containing protein [Burkholderiales bacterium]MDE2503841.1 cytochrome b/b6 domain-containing protein [Burkholderiales bacterium]